MSGTIVERTLVYDQFYRLWRVALRQPSGAVVERHIEDHGEPVALLPYDPERRVALLVSQPRAPVIDAGLPDLLEAIAGNRDNDGAETGVRREALEEAGVRIGALQRVATVWTMPSFSTEQLTLFLAEYRAEDRIEAGGGHADEAECITVHEMPLAELAERAGAGMLTDAKTLILVQALLLRRPELFAR